MKSMNQKSPSALSLPPINKTSPKVSFAPTPVKTPTPMNKKEEITSNQSIPNNEVKTNPTESKEYKDLGVEGKKKTKAEVLESLKNLNFLLNPQLHAKRKAGSILTSFETSKILNEPSAVSRNILEYRNRNDTQKNFQSLKYQPRLPQTRTLQQGTLSLLQNTEEARTFINTENKGFISTGKSELGEKARDRLRLQVVRWFLDNRKDMVKILLENKGAICTWVAKVGEVDKDQFEIILDHIGIKREQNIITRLFWLFDLNCDESIDHKEIAYSINLFREYTLEQKVQIFFELCDDDQSGLLDSEQVQKLFLQNLTSENEKKIAQFLSQDFLQCMEPQDPQGITRPQLLEAVKNDQNIKAIIDKNTRILKISKADEFSTPGYLLIPSQSESQFGIYYPYMDQMLRAIQDREQVIKKNFNLKMDQKSKANQLKSAFGQETDQEEDEDHF